MELKGQGKKEADRGKDRRAHPIHHTGTWMTDTCGTRRREGVDPVCLLCEIQSRTI